MKAVKQFLLAIAVVSFLLLAGCTTMQNIPYDGVYYSTTQGAPQNMASQTHATTPTQYKVIKLKTINTSGQNTGTSANQNLEGYSVDTLRTDTIKGSKVDSVVYSNINTGLGFNSPYFGTGIESWSLGGYASIFGNGWYDPFWYNFYYPYSYYPYYGYYGFPLYSYGGWGLYGFGYPYWGFGFGYPFYGYGYYGLYGYPYHYGFGPYGHNRYFGHRGSLLRGSNIPIGGTGGGLLPNAGTKSAHVENVKPSGIRPSSISGNSGTKAVTRPAGSMRYQKALNEARAKGMVNNGSMLQKPPVSRSTEKAAPAGQYTKPVFNRQKMEMSAPRYQKPKQYQSLDTRQARSINEYFRPQPQTIINGKTIRVNTVRRATQRFNIYRPSRSGSPSYYRRPVYNRSSYRSTPVQRYTSPRFYSSPTNVRNTGYRAPPVRISTGSSGGGGGSRGGGGGSGHIR